MEEKVFILHHTYEYGDEMEHEESKLLGIYSNKEGAEYAIERYKNLSGFREYASDCFSISCYTVDKDSGWTEGFVSTDEIARDFEALTQCFNTWLCKSGDVADSWEDADYYNALCEVNRKVYQMKNAQELAEHICFVWSLYFKDAAKTVDDCLVVATEVIHSLRLR